MIFTVDELKPDKLLRLMAWTSHSAIGLCFCVCVCVFTVFLYVCFCVFGVLCTRQHGHRPVRGVRHMCEERMDSMIMTMIWWWTERTFVLVVGVFLFILVRVRTCTSSNPTTSYTQGGRLFSMIYLRHLVINVDDLWNEETEPNPFDGPAQERKSHYSTVLYVVLWSRRRTGGRRERSGST